MTDNRELGLRWTDKGFGFIERESSGSDIFCHVRDLGGIKALVPGSKVSFVFEEDAKTGKAKEVQVEEAVEEVEQAREVTPSSTHKQLRWEMEADAPLQTGTVKKWNAEKGFGFIGRSVGNDCFVHKRECGGNDLSVGQAVSFVFEEDPKGGTAKQVREEEGGEPVIDEDDGERELGKVQSYNEEKGFAFILRCTGGDKLFAHKREFGSLEPWVGQPVSFIVESTEKGDAAKKIRDEESVPELVLSDEGREFGTIKSFIADKAYGFIARRAGGDNARFFEKQCNGMVPEKNMCVSFIVEETEKGPTAKDVREEDPERVERVTAKVHYGKVAQYWDPTDKRPTNGFGFVERLGDSARFYFHMSEIMDPDEDGGIEPDTGVSFIIVPARKGSQAAAVTIADPPMEEEKEEPALTTSFQDLNVGNDENAPPVVADLEDPNAW